MTNLSRTTPVPLARRARVLAGVTVVSCVIGAIAGLGATMLVGTLLGVPFFAVGFLGLSATTGIGVALVSGPLVAFTLLRNEPIGTSLLRSFVGALGGAAIGLWLALDLINPYAPLTIFNAPMWQASLGAIAGATALAFWTRWRNRARRKTTLAQ